MSNQNDNVKNTSNYLNYAFSNLNKKAIGAMRRSDKSKEIEKIIKHYQVEFCYLSDELERGPICNSFNVSKQCQNLFKNFAKEIGV